MHLFSKKIPLDKKICFALTEIEGIGHTTSLQICNKLGISTENKFKDLKDSQINKIRKLIQEQYVIRKELYKYVEDDIKKLILISCYRGLRHISGLSVRGQRSRTNCRTQRRLHNKRFKINSNTKK